MTAHGLSFRAPFLDNEVVEFLAKTIHPKNLRPESEAVPLKLLLKDVFPETLIQRPKVTRRDFLANWIDPAGMIPIFLTLKKGSLIESGLLSHSWIDKVTRSPKLIQRYFSELWALLILEIWFRLFIQRSTLDGPPKESIYELLGVDR